MDRKGTAMKQREIIALVQFPVADENASLFIGFSRSMLTMRDWSKTSAGWNSYSVDPIG